MQTVQERFTSDNDEGLRGSPDHFIKKEGKEKEKLFSFKTMQEKFLKSMRARLTVAQVVADVRSGAELTFDFIVYVILAAWIAAMGLLDNSVVNTVASMLVSPLMGPGQLYFLPIYSSHLLPASHVKASSSCLFFLSDGDDLWDYRP